MKFSLASANAIAAVLLLAHVCAPQHSTTTDASALLKWMRTKLINCMPGTGKPARTGSPEHAGGGMPKATKGGAAAPFQPPAKKHVVKRNLLKPVPTHQTEVQLTNSPDNGPLIPVYFSFGSCKQWPIQNPFYTSKNAAIKLNFKDANKNHIYKQYETEAMKKATLVSIMQCSIPQPTKLVSHSSNFAIKNGFYTYETYEGFNRDSNIANIWVNFACQNAFDHYDSGFVQDEIQNLEIPAEAAIAEHFRMSKGTLGKVHQSLIRSDGTPSPIIVTDMIRYMHFDSTTSKIYGAEKMRNAPTKAVDAAAHILMTPQTGIHVLALLAPKRTITEKGRRYSLHKIEAIFRMAFNGFLQAWLRLHYVSGDYNANTIPVVNSGNWGAGQFGNDLVLMALLQIAAARAAGVHLVAWAGGARSAWEEAFGIFDKKIWLSHEAVLPTEELFKRVKAQNFRWQK